MGLFIGGLLTVVLLSGCTEADLNATLNQEAGAEGSELSEDYVESAFEELNEKNKMPENVENGNVSEDIYKETLRYVTDFNEYEDKMMSFQNRLNNDSSLYDNEDFINQYKESMNAYDVFIKGFHLSSNTEIDFELERNLTDTLLYTSNMISALRQYIDTGDTYYVSSLEETVNNRNTSYEALGNSLMKHKLYTE